MKPTYFYLAICSIALAGCSSKPEQAATPPPSSDSLASLVSQVVGIANIEPVSRLVAITPESPGVVRQILVNVGDHVTQGQTLIVLENASENAQIAQSQSKLSTQETTIKTQNANADALAVRLSKAQNDLSRNESLFAAEAITKQQYDDSKYAYQELQNQLEAARGSVKQAQNRLVELQKDEVYTATVQQKKRITAPKSGTLLSLEAKIGSFLNNTTSIGDFAPDGPTMAFTEIDELFATKIKLGQKAYIRAQGATDTLAKGYVILASPYLRKKSLFSDNPSNLEDRRVREVRVQLYDAKNVLLGSRVECVILVP